MGFVSCQKELQCEWCINENQPPVAVAGPDTTIHLPNDSITLDGRASHDPDGMITQWNWNKISGPASAITSNANTAYPFISRLTAGIYLFELIVTDDKGLSGRDTVRLTVNDPALQNSPPVARAGADQVLSLPLSAVNLDGTASTDPDNNIVSYAWNKISGPASSTITNANNPRAQVLQPAAGTYRFELKVTDAGGLADSDTMDVTISTSAPPSDPCGAMCPIFSTCSFVCFGIPGGQPTRYTCAPNFSLAYGASASLSSKVYFAGGTDDHWAYGGSLDGGMEYDPATNTHRCFTLSVPRAFLAGATAGNKILFAGGVEVTRYRDNPVYNTVDIYDGQTLTHTIANLSEARSHIAAVSLGTDAFFIGGKTKGGYSGKMDIFSSTYNTWRTVSLPRERAYAGAAIIGNKLFIAGGQNSNGSIDTVDIYDILSGQWSTLRAPHVHPYASVALSGYKLIIAGGDGLSGRSADIYDVSTGLWSSVNLSSSRFYMTVAAANNKIVFLGGVHSTSGIMFANESEAIDVYDESSGTWSASSLNRGVSGTVAAVAGSQIIYTGFMWGNSLVITNLVAIVSP